MLTVGHVVYDMKYFRKLIGLVMIGRSINDSYTRCTTCLIIYRHNIYRHLFVPLYYTAILEMKRITKYYNLMGPKMGWQLLLGGGWGGGVAGVAGNPCC